MSGPSLGKTAGAGKGPGCFFALRRGKLRDEVNPMNKKDFIPTEPMKNPLGSSYPVDVLAQLESDAMSRKVFDAMPREIQLDILQHNTMTPEALRHFLEANKPRPSPITALLGEDANSRAYFRTASSKVKQEVWQAKFSGPTEEGR